MNKVASTVCAVCGKEFKPGDYVAFVVVGKDNEGIYIAPVHIECTKKSR